MPPGGEAGAKVDARSKSVVALLEADNSISREMFKRASNRLAAVTIWRGDETASMQRIEREVVGQRGLH